LFTWLQSSTVPPYLGLYLQDPAWNALPSLLFANLLSLQVSAQMLCQAFADHLAKVALISLRPSLSVPFKLPISPHNTYIILYSHWTGGRQRLHKNKYIKVSCHLAFAHAAVIAYRPFSQVLVPLLNPTFR
jgi:hypothetical protein